MDERHPVRPYNCRRVTSRSKGAAIPKTMHAQLCGSKQSWTDCDPCASNILHGYHDLLKTSRERWHVSVSVLRAKQEWIARFGCRHHQLKSEISDSTNCPGTANFRSRSGWWWHVRQNRASTTVSRNFRPAHKEYRSIPCRRCAHQRRPPRRSGQRTVLIEGTRRKFPAEAPVAEIQRNY